MAKPRSDLRKCRGYQKQALQLLDDSATTFLGAMKMHYSRAPVKEVQTMLVLERLAVIRQAMEECFVDM